MLTQKNLSKTPKTKFQAFKHYQEKYPDIVFGGMFSAALQEYSEACIFLILVKESRFVTPAEINVPSVDYVLGLADVIGEYRRLALDNLREGEVKKGEECLKSWIKSSSNCWLLTKLTCLSRG